MDKALTFRGRLPGVVCEAALPPPREAPLRLDVAAFVGFAERGPLDLPIAVEDISQYHEVFGGDLLLARTRLGDQLVFAALPQAVRAFFDNGGRRCYVVRVAGESAYANRFRLPGLIAWEKGQGFQTIIAPAAWSGRWSDTMSIGTELLSRPLRTSEQHVTWKDDTLELHLELPTRTTVQPNDLLRLQFGGPGKPIIYCFVERTQVTGFARTTTEGISVTIQAGQDGIQQFRSESGEEASVSSIYVERLQENQWKALPVQPLYPLKMQTGQKREASLFLPDTAMMQSESEKVRVGDLLRITFEDERMLFFPVTDVVLQQQSDDNGQLTAEKQWRIASKTMLWSFPPPSQPSEASYGTLLSVDLLNFNLYIREGQQTQEVWPDLRFGAGPNYWLDKLVPPLEQLQSELRQLDTTQHNVPGLDPTRSSRLAVPAAQTDGSDASRFYYFPLGMGELPGPDDFTGPLPDASGGSAIDPSKASIIKDGLENFDVQALFLDSRLAGTGVRDLLNEAYQLLYQNPPGTKVEPLRKLHSLLLIDEIGLISLPDLIQRKWDSEPPQARPPLPTSGCKPSLEPPVDWSQFHDCKQKEKKIDCAPAHSDVPDLPAESDAQHDSSEQLQKLPVIQAPEEYSIDELLVVQRALVKMCAARADVLAVLSLPLHFKRREVLGWQRRLPETQSARSGAGDGVLDGDFYDGTALSYAVVYHPWLQIREEVLPQVAPLRAMPPDGTICGMIAARELRRGPWIAPANAPLQGAVGLTPTFSAAEWADLFNSQINLIRQPPGQLTLLSAHTLSSDRLLLQISVRRLLIFLRKLALRQGMRYVFETNNERFRQAVQASFESILTTLAARGALTAFEVVTGSEINTPNDYDNGRFLIALKVAPTQPVEFITVVLLRAGEGLLEVIER